MTSNVILAFEVVEIAQRNAVQFDDTAELPAAVEVFEMMRALAVSIRGDIRSLERIIEELSEQDSADDELEPIDDTASQTTEEDYTLN